LNDWYHSCEGAVSGGESCAVIAVQTLPDGIYVAQPPAPHGKRCAFAFQPRSGYNVYAIFYYHAYHTEARAEAALAMQQSLRSAWILAETWNDGTTIWHSPAGDQAATVTPGGEIQIVP
jgi:hypothetical protein